MICREFVTVQLQDFAFTAKSVKFNKKTLDFQGFSCIERTACFLRNLQKEKVWKKITFKQLLVCVP